MELTKNFEGFYHFLWPENQERPDLRFLGSSMEGVSRDFLFKIAESSNLNPEHTILDLGCGTGQYSVALAKQFGAKIIGIDPLETNITFCNKRKENSVHKALLSFKTGFAEAIPLSENTVDFIWFRDALSLVQHLSKCFEECRRVLRPGGKILIYSGMRKRQITPDDLEKICVPMGIPPASLEQSSIENAISANGFNIKLSTSTNDEHSPYRELVTPEDISAFEKYCRLIRSKEKAFEKLGDQNYRYLESLYLWNVYVLMDKLHYQVYLLEKFAK